MKPLTLEEAFNNLKSHSLDPYLKGFFHGGAREFVCLEVGDPFDDLQVAWLASIDNPSNPKLHFEFYTTSDGKNLVKVWLRTEYLKSQERKQVVRAEMEVVRIAHEEQQRKEKKVRALFIRMYGETQGPKMFVAMMNGEMDIPGEVTEKEKFGLA
jgi:hypothetical protein